MRGNDAPLNGPVLHASAVLESLTRRLLEEFGLRLVVASEIEFYLHGAAQAGNFSAFGETLDYALGIASVNAGPLEKERGGEQYEIALKPGHSPLIVAEDTRRLVQIVTEQAAQHGMRADFSAKPFATEPGSGLHLHVHLEDRAGNNQFFKQDDSYTDTLLHAVGGLLASLPEAMPFFAPSKQSYARFMPGYNVPVTVSWGANNRTVAVRLPTSADRTRHLEHRVCGADADPVLAMIAVAAGILHGLKQRVSPGEQIFGDASLPIYALPPLPKDLRHALACLQEGRILPQILGAPFCQDVIRNALK